MTLLPIISMVLGFIVSQAKFRNIISTQAASFVSSTLLFLIGLKGGSSISFVAQDLKLFLYTAIIGATIGFIQPFIFYFFIRKFAKLDIINSATLASQYGSISLVTFATGMQYLLARNVPFDSFMSGVAGLMEIPAIIAGFIIIHLFSHNKKALSTSPIILLNKIIKCKSINLIFLGIIIGLIVKILNLSQVKDSTTLIFMLVLNIFMFSVGIKIFEQKESLLKINKSILAFGIITPILSALIGLALGYILELGVGSSVLFSLLIASASYIAVPAVMKATFSEVKDAIIFPVVLGITLPFNIIVVLPLIYNLAQLVLK